jgi:hypothetical protein
VRLEGAGQYFFRQGGRDGLIVLEAGISHEARTARLVPGAYFVQHRLPDRLREARVVAEEGRPLELANAAWSVVELDQLVRKGDGGSPAWTLSGWGAAAASLLEGYPFSPAGAVQVSLDTAALTLDAQVELAHVGFTEESFEHRLTTLAMRVGARKVFDVERFSLSGGVRLGASYVDQRFFGRVAPRLWQVVPHLDTVLRADLHLPRGFFVGVEAGVRASRVRALSLMGQETVRTPVTPMFAAGTGIRW